MFSSASGSDFIGLCFFKKSCLDQLDWCKVTEYRLHLSDLSLRMLLTFLEILETRLFVRPF